MHQVSIMIQSCEEVGHMFLCMCCDCPVVNPRTDGELHAANSSTQISGFDTRYWDCPHQTTAAESNFCDSHDQLAKGNRVQDYDRQDA